MEDEFLVLYGEFFVAWSATRDAEAISAGESVARVLESSVVAVGDKDSCWIVSDAAMATMKCSDATACWAWEFVLRNAKALGARVRHAIGLQKLCKPTADWRSLTQIDFGQVLSCIAAYYAYQIQSFGVDISATLPLPAFRIFSGAPRDAPRYLEDRGELIEFLHHILTRIPRRGRGLVVEFAVPESVCGYFLRALRD